MNRARLRSRLAAAVLVALVVSPAALRADPRPHEVLDAAQIRLGLEKLNVVGTALYVGAHPDDENTAMLVYLSRGRLVRTLYLSMTRGDGGQNLLGTDVGERLGVIRTQELLAARRVDGAEQRFTRALDFGFSKRSDETLALWGHDRILEDVVWHIRRLRPDILITRFPPDSTAGHGHHAASAILAEEAFSAAADSTRFSDQLKYVKPWAAKRLVWNVFRFGNAGPDTSRDHLSVDVGDYNALLGRSYTEIAGESRSMHKTQGFGAAERRGSFTNTFTHRLGDRATRDLFDGVDLTWSRFRGGERVTPLVQQAIREFDPRHPAAIVPLLLRIRGIALALGDDPILVQKRAEIDELIRSCAGIWCEAIASAPMASPGAPLRVTTSILAREPQALDFERVELTRPGLVPAVLDARRDWRSLPPQRAQTDTFALRVPADAEPAQPYWLRRPAAGAWFELPDPLDVSLPENFPALSVKFYLGANGEHFQLEVPVVYRWVDPVQGERYRNLDVVPAAALTLGRGVYLFPDAKPRPVEVTVRSLDVPVRGRLRLDLPEGWKSEPAAVPIALAAGEVDTVVSFTVTPGAAGRGALSAVLEDDAGARWRQDRVTLDYPHVPMQTLLPPATARLVRADVRITGREVGYVMGSGDQIPQALGQMGFHVTLLDDDTIERGDLSRYGTIVIGVRAYNTRPRLLAHQKRLLDWVRSGGRLVVQYVTPDPALNNRIGPLPLTIASDRVTVEDAPVTLRAPSHPLLTTPNRIGADDFSGWVQERGLSFARSWDAGYEAPLSCHDPGEPDRNGGLLSARYGKGVFVYTGYAWFRQIPAGVPGAWRLLANLVSGPK